MDKPFIYDRMHEKLESNPGYAKRMMRMRSKTVEPVLGTLNNFTNMRRINTRGIKQANKHILIDGSAGVQSEEVYASPVIIPQGRSS